MKVKFMVVPGKLLELKVPAGTTVLSLAKKAAEKTKDLKPKIDWVGLVQNREVRVNKRKFSNKVEIDSTKGYVGSILVTPLADFDVVLIITKIQGNEEGVLTCTINGEEYALETPNTIANVLRGLTDINPNDVVSVTVDGDEAHLEDLIGDDDYIVVKLQDDADDDEDDDDSPVIVVDGESFEADSDGKLAAIEAILQL